MRSFITFLCCVTLSAACSDDDRSGWRFDEPNEEEAAAEDGGIEPDLPSVAPNSDAGSDPPPNCLVDSLVLGEPNHFPGNPQTERRGLVELDDGLASKNGEELFAWRPANPEPVQHYSVELGARLLGGGGQIVLTAVDFASPLIAFDLSDESRRELAPQSRNTGVFFFGLAPPPRRVDFDGTALFVTSIAATQRLAVANANGIDYIADTAPYLFEIGEGRVAWGVSNQGSENVVSTWFDGVTGSTTIVGTVRDFEVSEANVFWNSSGEVWRWDGRASPERLAPETDGCGAVTWDRSRRVAWFACPLLEGPDTDVPYHAFYRWSSRSGLERTELEIAAEPYGLRAEAGVLVWAEYPREAVGPITDDGELRGWAPGMHEPQLLDSIGQGCLSCGAYWLPAEIVLTDGMLGHTYAEVSDGFVWDRFVEMRTIEPRCRTEMTD